MTSSPANYPVSAAAYPAREHRTVRGLGRVAWGPIMMGAVCAIGLQFIFTVLGIALGTSATEVAGGVDGDAVRTVGVAAGLWWLVTGTVALAAGGFVFGRLSGLPQSLALMLEAAAMWGVVALFGFLLIWSGTGTLSQAASPIAAISISSERYAQQSGGAGMTGDRGQSSGSARSTDTSTSSTALAEEARRATRTASWWSVFGLIAGLGASLGGAIAGVRSFGDEHELTHR